MNINTKRRILHRRKKKNNGLLLHLLNAYNSANAIATAVELYDNIDG